MTQEKLHEALNMLDDELIQATDVLRSRRKKHNWIAVASLAACLCLIISIFSFPSFHKGMESNAGMTVTDDGYLNGPENMPAEMPETGQVYTLRVHIKELTDNGFFVSVVSENAYGYQPGQSIAARFAPGAEVALKPGMEITVRCILNHKNGELIIYEVEQ